MMRRMLTYRVWAFLLVLGMMTLLRQARAQSTESALLGAAPTPQHQRVGDEAPYAPQRPAAANAWRGSFKPTATPSVEYKQSVWRGMTIAGSIGAPLSIVPLVMGLVFTGSGCEFGLRSDPYCVFGNALIGSSAITGIAGLALFAIGLHLGQDVPRRPALPPSPMQPASAPRITSRLELRSSSSGQLWLATSF